MPRGSWILDGIYLSTGRGRQDVRNEQEDKDAISHRSQFGQLKAAFWANSYLFSQEMGGDSEQVSSSSGRRFAYHHFLLHLHREEGAS
jgi:hypothetical protein